MNRISSSLLAVAMAIGLHNGAMAQTTPPAPPQAPVLRICAGSEAGNYTFAANQIVQRLGRGVFSSVQVITTGGSTDNMRRLAANECDVGFSQSDVALRFGTENPAATNQIAQFAKVYKEYTHLLCPASAGISRVVDLGRRARDGKPARLIVGSDGSGAAQSWRWMRQADPGLYDKVERLPEDVGIASIGTVADSNDTCMLWISGLNSADMQAANARAMGAGNTRRMVLVDFDDRDMKALRGPDGRPVYTVETITRVAGASGTPGRYDNLIPSGTFSSGSITVLGVDALLMMRIDYQRQIGSRVNNLRQAVDDATPTIVRRVNPT